jgi:hypothetical protein
MFAKGVDMKIIASSLVLVIITGCAEESYVVLNTATLPSENFKVIDKPRDVVMEASVQELGKQFALNNTPDESSGLINITYGGDPEKFLDCGNFTSSVKDAQGERTYKFPNAKAETTYETMNGNVLFYIDRKISLDAHINLSFKELNPNQTQVAANTLYLVQKEMTAKRKDNNFTQRWSDSISFNTHGSGTFRNDFNSAAQTVCVSNGELEREVLSAIK